MQIHGAAVAAVVILLQSTDAFTFNPYYQQINKGNGRFTTGFKENGIIEKLQLNAANADEGDDEPNGSIVTILRNDAYEAGRKASQAEKRVKTLQQELKDAEAKLAKNERVLKEGERSWEAQKTNLLERIGDFTKQLQDREMQSKKGIDDLTLQTQKRQSELEKQVLELKASLKTAQNETKKQKEAAAHIMDRLMKTEDQLEFEQMRFQKEKETLDKSLMQKKESVQAAERQKDRLQQQIEEGISRLQLLQDKLISQKDQFQQEKNKLQGKITHGERVRQLKARQMGQRYQNIRKELTSLWVNAKTEARKEQKALKDQIYESDITITQLQSQLDQAKADSQLLDQLRDQMQEQKSQANRDKLKAQQQFDLKFNQQNQLISDLEQNITLLTNDKTALLKQKLEIQDQLQSKKSDVENIRYQLEADKQNFQKEKNILQNQIEEGERIRKLKTKQMANRFQKIRAEMTALLVSTKNQARKEEQRLKQKHQAQIQQKNNAIATLQNEIEELNSNAEELNTLLEVTARKRDDALEEIDRLEKKLFHRTNEITQLKSNVTELKRSIEEKDEQIVSYQSKYREMFKLAVNLTKKRVRNTGSRLRDSVRFSRKGKQRKNE